MLDIKFIRENAEKVKEVAKYKQLEPKVVDRVLELDKVKRKLLGEVEELRAQKNKYAGEKDVKKGKEIKLKLQSLEPKLSEIEKEFTEAIYKVPNMISDDTPIGKDESENKVVRKWGKPPKFKFTPKDHLELGEQLDIIDSKLAGKIVGARFVYLKGDAVLLQNALHQFAMEKLLKKGFTPILPPLFINPEVYIKMARLSPETEIERYKIDRDNQYLIGSAEHTLGPMYIDTVFNQKDLPKRFFAFTPAFRREAGSYGKDTKGILRQHQFDKLEMESFTTPGEGAAEQDFLIGIQEEIMQELKIAYQVVAICTGDMGAPDFRQVDINSWMPGQNKYRETHTSDYMTDYQSRRLNTKVRVGGEVQYVHMNDATAIAMGRTIIAILENYQNEDGSVNIPKVLQKWMGKEKIKKTS